MSVTNAEAEWVELLSSEDLKPVSEEQIQKISSITKALFSSYAKNHSSSAIQKLQPLLRRLLETHSLSDITGTHRVASCNLLCGLISNCVRSTVAEVRAVGTAADLWKSLFHLYLHRSDHSKVKSMRLVLSTLGDMMLSNQEAQWSKDIRGLLSRDLVSIIFDEDAHSRVKPAFQALEFFLSKNLLPVTALLAVPPLSTAEVVEDASPPTVSSPNISSHGDLLRSMASSTDAEAVAPVERSQSRNEQLATMFVSKALEWIPHPDVAPAAGNAVVTFYGQIRKSPSESLRYRVDPAGEPIWVQTLYNSVQAKPEALHAFKQHLFPGLFKIETADMKYILNRLDLPGLLAGKGVRDDPRCRFLFSVLQVGKELRFVVESESRRGKDEFDDTQPVLPDDVLATSLIHRCSTIRSAALSLVITSPEKTRALQEDFFPILRMCLRSLHADTDARFRNDVITFTKRLLHRLVGGISHFGNSIKAMDERDSLNQTESGKKRSPVATRTVKSLQRILQAHEEFVRWYLSFLTSELQPGRRYQTHITGLKSLNLLLQSGLVRRVPHLADESSAQTGPNRPMQVCALDPAVKRLLLDLLMDPFEDVRSEAASILGMFCADAVKWDRPDESDSSTSVEAPRHVAPSTAVRESFHRWLDLNHQGTTFRRRSLLKMSQSCRADHSDGFAHGQELLFNTCSEGVGAGALAEAQDILFTDLLDSLEQQVRAASEDLLQAACDSPIHGHLTSLRYILESDIYAKLKSRPDLDFTRWRLLHQRIISSCAKLWECVKSVLCNDSPEGHVPEHDSEIPIDTKEVLSFSWRALKESSLLLKTIILKAVYDPRRDRSMLVKADIEKIGTLTFSQLAELRHRGAFSAVSLTFAACCQRCAEIDDADITGLLRVWFQKSLEYIRNNSIINTRRSAGIPSLITGILGANLTGSLTDLIFQKLLGEARGDNTPIAVGEEGTRSQVHAMNCLKDIFTDTRLASTSESYIPNGLDLAVTSLASNTWAVRNGGIMLFRALVDRLVGTSRFGHEVDLDWSRGSSKISYEKYPSLAQLLPRLLEGQSGDHHRRSPNLGLEDSVQMVFPGLDLLRRAGPPKASYSVLKHLVRNQLGNPVWHIRDLAARTYTSLVSTDSSRSPDGILTELEHLLPLDHGSQNERHGKLLAFKYMLEKGVSAGMKVVTIAHVLRTMLKLKIVPWADGRCLITQAAFFDVMNLLLKGLLRASVPIGGDIPAETTSSIMATYEMAHDLNEELQSDRPVRKAPHCNAAAEQLPAGDEDAIETDEASVSEQLESPSPEREILGPTLNLCLGLCTCLIRDFQALEIILQHQIIVIDHYPSILEELTCIAPYASKDFFRVTMLGQIIHANAAIAAESESTAIAAQAMKTIADVFDDHAWARDSFSACTSEIVKWDQPRPGAPPSFREADLRLRGHDLARRYQEVVAEQERMSKQDQGELEEKIGKWFYLAQDAANENNDFDTRYAAAQSLNALDEVLIEPGPAHTRHLLLRAFLLLYDTLNDDDEEIRILGANLTSRVLSNSSDLSGSRSLVPLEASLRLSKRLVLRHENSDALSWAAICRLTGDVSADIWDLQYVGPLLSVAEQLAEARKEDTSLFVVEKQNLFIDPIREAEIWSGVLRHHGHSRRASMFSSTSQLLVWVTDGVKELLRTVREEVDGPLGWTSKPDVFIIGMRVLIAAELVLGWEWGTECETRVLHCRRDLDVLANIGDEKELHGCWMSKITAILCPSEAPLSDAD